MQTDPITGAVEVHAGLVLGRYELLTPIAAGGMAQVWAARLKGARQFQKIVAVKTILPKLSEDAQFEQMFLDEASLASQIRHPNAVEIMDLGESHGILYLVMEWIDGIPLNQLMKVAKTHGGVPLPIAARIAMQACSGLHAAHELHDEKGRPVGLVHRDVSPQNLLVTYDGVTKVVDFGVAKATALGTAVVTQAGQVKGKVSYMAPEQVNGEGLDRRADVFALGIVLYALATGKHPFRRESEAATMYNICSKDAVVAPSSVIEGFPKELELILLKALEKDRDNRFSTCDEMLRALDALPSHLRVGSDADVAFFVKSLMSDRRLEQRRRIDEAIARADASPSGAWAAGDLTNGGSRGSRTSVTVTPDLSGLTSAQNKQAMRNRFLGVVGLAALAISGGILAAALLSQGDDAQKDVQKSTPQGVDPAAASTQISASTPAQPDPGTKATLADLPEEQRPRSQNSARRDSTEPADSAEPADNAEPADSAESTDTEGTTEAATDPALKPRTRPNRPNQPNQPSDSWKYGPGF